MNNLENILKLLDAMAGLPFETMEVSTADVTVKVSRSAAGAPVQAAPPVRVEQKAEAVSVQAPEEKGKKPAAITSPIIGVFYAAPSPDDAPFVRVGEQVKAGQTLCIVEAMKLMNEIPSPVSGTLVKVLAQDGSEVEVGQTLFLIDVSEG